MDTANKTTQHDTDTLIDAVSQQEQIIVDAATRSEPMVSLLMPIYNVERYLPQSLTSAQSQTLRNIEIICIDDGSTDASSEIIAAAAKEDSRIHVLTKANSGYGDSMNHGLAMARGRYIGVLEPDDVMDANALELLVNAAESFQVDIAKANFNLWWAGPPQKHEFKEIARTDRCGSVQRPLDNPFIFYQKASLWSAVYRRSFLERARITFLPTPGAAFQDTSFSFKAYAAANSVIYLHNSVLNYRQDNENSSINSSNKAHALMNEYSEIDRWIKDEYAREHREKDVHTLLRIMRLAQYDDYMWSYVRLAEEYRTPFLERMAAEYRKAIAAGEIDLRDLKPWKRVNLEGIVRDPDAWARENASYAEAGPLGRAWHYLKQGGPGLLIAYVASRGSNEYE